MALKPFNSINGYSVGNNGNVVVYSNLDVNGNTITANGNLTVAGTSNLNQISNVKILGGTEGQGIVTDGTGNLSFTTLANPNSAAPMPYYIPTGNTSVVPTNYQGLFSKEIEIDGTFTVDGVLIQINDTVDAANTQVLFNVDGTPTGNTGFTFNSASGNLSVPGFVIANLAPSGNLIPATNNTYTLGNSTHRWKDLYLSGNTIYVGTGTIGTDANGAISLLNGTGGELVVGGNSIITSIENGNSNISITTNGNVVTSVRGNAAVFTVTGTGANVFGTLSVSGNLSTNNAIFSNSITINDGVISSNGGNAGIFNGTTTSINLGLSANITMGGNASTVTVNNDLDVLNVLDAPSITVGDLYSRRSSVPVTTNTVIDSFPKTFFRTAKYTIRASNDSGYQAIEVLLVHDNINSIITVYGSLSTTGNDLVTLSTDINGANVELKATGSGANTTINLLGTYVPD